MSSLSPPERLRPGRHQLTRADVTRSQRERMLVATLQSVFEHGYAATTVADVVSRAAVSRTTFYGQFADKEACFIAAYDFAMHHALSQFEEATQGRAGGSWRERVRADLSSYLQVLMAEPALAVTLHLEVLAAGPAALEHRAELLSFLASRIAGLNELAQQGDGSVRQLPAALFALYTGGLDELIRDRLRTGQVEGLHDLADPLVEATCAMFGGQSASVAVTRRKTGNPSIRGDPGPKTG